MKQANEVFRELAGLYEFEREIRRFKFRPGKADRAGISSVKPRAISDTIIPPGPPGNSDGEIPAMPTIPAQFDGVSVVAKANVYFDGKVVSHTVLFPGGVKKTIGLIYPGSFLFNTGAPEKMEIVAGECKVKLKGAAGWEGYSAGTAFDVPGDSAFEISVESGIAEYICSFG